MSRIGNEIRIMRERKGMTQKQLGKHMGVSEKFIDEVEAGKKILNGDLVSRVYKILGMQSENKDFDLGDESGQGSKKDTELKPVQQLWSDALGNILKKVFIYDYALGKELGSKQLPIVSNKVEGYPKEKVFYLQIEDNEMLGFRIAKGDLALACSTSEVDTEGIYLIEKEEGRMIRQVKTLDKNRLLLIRNEAKLVTETASPKEVKVLARLIRVEFML